MEQPLDALAAQDADPRALQRHLELAADITQAFAASLDIDETLRVALHRVMDSLDAEAASIFVIEEGQGDLVCRACAGPVNITGTHLKADEGVVGKAFQRNRVQIVRDVRREPDFSDAVDKRSGFRTRSILCAPLTVKNEHLGAIELINKRSGDGLFHARDKLLLEALCSSAALAIHNSNMAHALVGQERLHRELELASEIQRNLLPAQAAPGSAVHGMNIPAREVSGDFFDYFPIDDERICFNVGDVSGKGINAAMLMAKTSSLFHCLGKTIHDPGTLLQVLNDELVETSTRGMFVTMIGGIYEPGSGRLRLANAGHQPVLVLHDSGSATWIAGSSPPLGIVAGLRFPECEVRLQQAAAYLYTDGVTEARRPDGSSLNPEGFERILRRHGSTPRHQRLQAIVDDILGEVEAFRDDMTMLMIDPEE
jgi:sigma-B regulation protein RsbU (phosphoserine phosphatase)